MGMPNHYSVDLPSRCLALIDGLWDDAARLRDVDRPDLGPLTSTFLLSMAMPIVNLPIERIERHKNQASNAYADDRFLNKTLSNAVSTTLGGQLLENAEFFESGSWSYARISEDRIFNIAHGLLDPVADDLGGPAAFERARKLQGSQWSSILRNAMAHGGILYLDRDGKSSYGQPVRMFAFVSGVYGDPMDKKRLTGQHLLRIEEMRFRSFLRQWVSWLRKNHLLNNPVAA